MDAESSVNPSSFQGSSACRAGSVHHCARAGIPLLAVFAMLLLAACARPPDAPFTIGTNSWPGYEPLYLAQHLGYLEDSTVKLVRYPNATEVIRAFRNGLIQAAALTFDEVLLLVEKGLDPHLVLVMDISHGSDAIIGRPQVTDITGLQGKRVGVENTALGSYVLMRALQTAGLHARDVEVVPLPVNEQEAAFVQGRVDAVVTFDPVRTHLLARGGNNLFDSTRISGEIVDVLVVRREFLEHSRKQVDSLLDVWFHVQDYIRQHPEEAALSMGKQLGMDTAEFQAAMQGMQVPDRSYNEAMLYGNSPQLLEVGEKLAQVMLEHRLLDKAVPIRSIFGGAVRDKPAP